MIDSASVIGRFGPELDAVGDQFGDDELQVLEHVGREDLIEHLKRRAGLRGRVFGGWELEAELHGALRAYVPRAACDIPDRG